MDQPEDAPLVLPVPAISSFHPIEDVPLLLHAELDRQTISFGELLALKTGSVLSLSRPTGENVDLYAGDVLLGSCEILVVDSTLAIRVADLARPEEQSLAGWANP
ncbi:MAG: FliM/FliN family flagellar motor switch protein [Acidobacteriaceae bacterium]|nr:FliM/FliN family flagellar motor switch protein [Acidobacteriaceae bacterium]